MHSDWEQRSSAVRTGMQDGLDVTETEEGNRRLGLKDFVGDLTEEILSGALVSEAHDVSTELPYIWGVPYTYFE